MKADEPMTAKRIRPTREALIIVLPNRQVQIPWEECSPRLGPATEEQRLTAELSPAGYGIHWPRLDGNLSISGLLPDENDRTRG